MGAQWEIQYARTSDGIDVAYAVHGEGSQDVVLIHGFTTHLDLIGDSPWHAYWTRRLGERFRVIELDKRGTGLSDRSLGHGSIEDRMRDVVAVMDAAGSTRASMVGISEGGPISLALASTYPERVDRLVLYGTAARFQRSPDYPIGFPVEVTDAFTKFVVDAWGTGEAFATFFINHAPDVDAAIASMSKLERNGCTRQMAGDIMRHNIQIDVRPLLPVIDAPTLVVHNVGDPLVPVDFGRYVAQQIAGARYVEGDGDYHCTWIPEEFEPLMDEVIGFLADQPVGAAHERPTAPTRSVATILFTDIVGSTDRAASMGDQGWSRLLDQHHRVAAHATRSCGGTLVKTTGDGILALFDGPSRAIHAAHKLRRGVDALGIEIRAGVHTGEVERSSDDVAGIGVHIAARVMGLAGPNEVLASRTVRDLAAGSGLEFVDRGVEQLRGVPGEWEVFAVARRPD